MPTEMITFGDLRRRQMIDIVGGILEFPVPLVKSDELGICRGKIERIKWWDVGHPETFFCAETMIWNETKQTWRPVDESQDWPVSFNFKRAMLEDFTGPYALETGEISASIHSQLFITIFPFSIEPPEKPTRWKVYAEIHASMMLPQPRL